MLKRMLCRAEFTWELECDGPLLIRDERYKPHGEAKEGYAQCLFMSRASGETIKREKESWNGAKPELPWFVPGTSLRGPFRAQAERIIRTLCPEDAQPPGTACDPFQDKTKTGPLPSCGSALETIGDNDAPYRHACPACRIFGCTRLAGRILFSDTAIESGVSVYRDMIGIDRFTGGVSANMKMHVLEKTRFTPTTVSICNFELWHLGLLAYVFRDFAEGLVPIGFGKTKGFGQVKGTVSGIRLTYSRPVGGIEHLGSLMGEAECDRYGIAPVPAPMFEFLQEDDGAPWGWNRRYTIDRDHMEPFFRTVAGFFNDHIDRMNRRAA